MVGRFRAIAGAALVVYATFAGCTGEDVPIGAGANAPDATTALPDGGVDPAADGASSSTGTQGGPCYGNDSCNVGLTCVSSVCELLDQEPIVGDGGDVPEGGRLVFITSAAYRGTIVSRENPGVVSKAAADAVCSSLAAAAKRAGTFVALLGGEGALGADLPERGEWFRLDGKRVFDTRPSETAVPAVGIVVNEKGGPVDPKAEVWTGVGRTGSVAHCNLWRSSSESVRGHIGQQTDLSKWLAYSTQGCNTTHRLYCFQK